MSALDALTWCVVLLLVSATIAACWPARRKFLSDWTSNGLIPGGHVPDVPQALSQNLRSAQAECEAWAAARDAMNEHMIHAAAEAAHEANRVYCAAIGDASQKPWAEAEQWQRASAIEGVRVALAGATPEQQHEAWCEVKRRDGWTFGPVKDATAKTHPCLVPYADLPAEQRAKDSLYIAVVRGMFAACQQQSGHHRLA